MFIEPGPVCCYCAVIYLLLFIYLFIYLCLVSARLLPSKVVFVECMYEISRHRHTWEQGAGNTQATNPCVYVTGLILILYFIVFGEYILSCFSLISQ